MASSRDKGESAPTKVRRLAIHGGLVRPSVYVRRSKITISLEPSVWEAFQEIAAEQGKTVTQLTAEIERRRIGNNLSAAIRVYIIEYYRAVISGGRI
jgi:predicted DNA-binding ribbon-helix-helix protein